MGNLSIKLILPDIGKYIGLSAKQFGLSLIGILIFLTSCGTESTPVYTLTVTMNGEGTVSPSSGGFDEGTSVTITANPNENWLFQKWSGDINGTTLETSISMDNDKIVTANFTRKEYPLTINIEGEGTVEEQIIYQPKKTDYEYETVVELTSVANEGWKFIEWSGDVNGSKNPVPITIDDEKRVTAIFEPVVYLADNGITILCPNGEVGDIGTIDGVEYEVVGMASLTNKIRSDGDLTKICTSLITRMNTLFYETPFNRPIGNWDVSNVKDMSHMFRASMFNQSIESWNVSNVTNMSHMFYDTPFNQPIGNWDVSNVIDMSNMFRASKFNQPIDSWDVNNVTDMRFIFSQTPFNHPIGSWDVSSVTNMSYMFHDTPFNHLIGNWDVSSVTDMFYMLSNSSFNQPLNDWNVSNVTNMSYMFYNTPFNQAVGGWDVSKVTDMSSIFSRTSFNQPVGNWDVSNVKEMVGMFAHSNFDQPINSWTVSSVENMGAMFSYSPFNQPIENWNVSSVEIMTRMFNESNFNQNISNWCVSKFTTEPDGFSVNAPLTEENKPTWGTCPSN